MFLYEEVEIRIQTGIMPQCPAEGEYACGMIQQPITVGDGPQKVIEKEVMLVPCSEDKDGNGVGDACET